jgi:PPOX class probable FMN-dependent enzyme
MGPLPPSPPGRRGPNGAGGRVPPQHPAPDRRGSHRYCGVMHTIRRIRSEAELRELIGEPTELVQAKLHDRLNDLTRQFVERSPFVCVATAHPDGGLDVSPRGDPPGFVRVLDEHTLLLPERPGNKLADTLTNLLADPRIGLLFLVPGIGDTFRVNGTAVVTDDAELLAGSAVDGKVPRLGILVSVREAYTQCAKALIRSDLWNPAHHRQRSELPSHGAILRSIRLPDLDVAEHERARAERYARGEGLY